jgi:hypothetical protein
MAPQANESSNEPHRSYTLDIVLAAAVVVLVAGGSYLMYRAEYLGGMSNDPNQGFITGFPLLLAMLPLTFVVVVCELVRLFPWPRTSGHRLLRLAFLLFPPVVFSGSFVATTPLAEAFLKGFERWVAREADLDALQDWLTTGGRRFASESLFLHRENSEALPACLTSLRPWHVSFRAGGTEDEITVELCWPAGFSDEYGLVIGPPTMGTPKTGMIKVRQNCHEFRRPVRPGAYIFTRG